MAKLFDEEVVEKAKEMNGFVSACLKLVDETIDPVIRQHATEAAGYLQATSASLGIVDRALTADELITFRKEGKLCLKCDTSEHPECGKAPTVCLNCRGNRNDCIRGCKYACRVCGAVHTEKSIIVCLENTVAPKPAKRPIEETKDDDLFEFSDEDGPKEAKKLRSVKEYRENKRKAKGEKRSTTTAVSVTDFEKLLKDTVARICFAQLGSKDDEGVEVPQWRKVYRSISTILMDKETRLPDNVRFKCKTAEEQSALVKRVTEYTNDYLKKH